MEFLDRLILGPDTPLHSDNVQYPSKVYRKVIINKDISNKNEIYTDKTEIYTDKNEIYTDKTEIYTDKNETFSDKEIAKNMECDIWKFWALFLVKPLNRHEAFINYGNIKEELRMGIWNKLIGRVVSLNTCVDGKVDIERDNFLLKCVISKFRDNSEEEIFNILRIVKDTHLNVDNFVLLVDFTYHIINMPYSDKLFLETVLVGLFGNYEMGKLFTLNGSETNLLNTKITKFESFVYKDPGSLYKLIDLVLFTNTSILEVLEDDYIPCLKEGPNTNLIKNETYFDFLMVQNENIRAQEVIKGDLIRVEKENEELRRQIHK